MDRRILGRRAYVTSLGAGVIGAVAGCVGGSSESIGSNDIVIWVRNGDATATTTVENAATGEVLFEESDSFSELVYPEDGPNARYDDVFGTDTVRITFAVRDGPERRREFSGGEDGEIHITYDGSIIELTPTSDWKSSV